MTFSEKTAIAAVIGGTAEALGGGKFANGAVTGAFVEMYNHLMEQSDGKNVPSKEWIESKVNAAIEAEKQKIQNWIDGGGGALNEDFNFEGYDNSAGAFGLYNDNALYEIMLNIDGQQYEAFAIYNPSDTYSSNIVTDIYPAKRTGYYGNLAGLKGKYQLFFNSVGGGKRYTPVFIYISEDAYNHYLKYTKDED